MKIVCVSDTHEQENNVIVPAGDVLIHSGDFTNNGRWFAFEKFLLWMEAQPHSAKILVAGNHDFMFQREGARARQLVNSVAPSVTYLQDEEVTINGLKFYGSPWTPEFMKWAFMKERGLKMRAMWSLIPHDTQVLITHGPAHGTLDLTQDGTHVGCEQLSKYLPIVRPLLHVFGHIHTGYGVHDTIFAEGPSLKSINAAACDDNYAVVNPPIVVDA